MKKVFYIIFLTLFLNSISLANNSNPNVTANIGIFITDIFNINLKNKTADVIFWLWITTGKDNPSISTPDIINSLSMKVLAKKEKVLNNGNKVIQYKMKVKVHQKWNFKDFPFSRDKLLIIIEDTYLNNDQLVFKIDKQDSGISKGIHISGGIIEGFNSYTRIKDYNSSLGQNKTNHIKYHQVIYEVNLKYSNIRVFIQVFGMIFLSFFLILFMFFIPINKLRGRLGLNSAAIFTIVGSRISTDTILPPSGSLTLIDYIQLLTLILLAITFISIFISFYLYEKSKSKALLFNKLTLTFITLLMCTSFIYLTYLINSH